LSDTKNAPPRTIPSAAAIAEGAPKVDFGGQQWPVPKLAFKQIKLIHKRLDRLATLLITNPTPMGEYTDEDLEDLAYTLHVALTRAHPALTRDEFDEYPTDRLELSRAFFVVLVQANGTRKASEPGEAEGAASP
jgi:hypothetical protein